MANTTQNVRFMLGDLSNKVRVFCENVVDFGEENSLLSLLS
jgi:hypothetical protein